MAEPHTHREVLALSRDKFGSMSAVLREALAVLRKLPHDDSPVGESSSAAIRLLEGAVSNAEWTVAYYQDELDKLWPESPREGT